MTNKQKRGIKIMTDIDIKCIDGTFKIRACGIIEKQGKILAQKAHDIDGFCFPGGHVSIGETAATAVVREIKEELHVETEIEKLICVHEHIYTNNKLNKPAQEIGYYFVLKPISDLPDGEFSVVEDSENKLQYFEWIDKDKLKDVTIRPSIIKDAIINNYNTPLVISTDER